MNHTPNSFHKLYLYCMDAGDSQRESDPPIQIDLLRRRDLQAAASMAQFAFSLPDRPRFCWDSTSAWLDCSPGIPGIYLPAFSHAQDFICALPQLQIWLAAWSESPGRTPDLEPAWATERNLDTKAVNQFAALIEQHLSALKTRRICYSDADGCEAILLIPPRSSLSLPPAQLGVEEAVHVLGKEDMTCCCLPTGVEVLLPSPASVDTSQPIVIDPRFLRPIRLTTAGRIRPLQSSAYQEVNDGGSHGE